MKAKKSKMPTFKKLIMMEIRPEDKWVLNVSTPPGVVMGLPKHITKDKFKMKLKKAKP